MSTIAKKLLSLMLLVNVFGGSFIYSKEFDFLKDIEIDKPITSGALSPNITSVALSSDNKKALTGSSDGSVLLSDLSAGSVLQKLTGHESSITSVALSPDDKTALTGSLDGSARLWDLSSGQQLKKLYSGNHVNCVAFSHDGNTALTGANGGSVKLWDLSSGKQLKEFRLPGFGQPAWAVTFRSQDATVLAAGGDGSVVAWDRALGNKIKEFQGPTEEISSIRFSPDIKTILFGLKSGTASLWDFEAGKQLHIFQPQKLKGDILKASKKAVNAVAFSPDSKAALTGSYRGPVDLWDVKTGKLLQNLKSGQNPIADVAFSPDNSLIAAASTKILSLWKRSS